MRDVMTSKQGEDLLPERFILIVSGDTPEGRQCLREIMNARQAETAAIRKYLNLTEARAQKAAAASAGIDNK